MSPRLPDRPRTLRRLAALLAPSLLALAAAGQDGAPEPAPEPPAKPPPELPAGAAAVVDGDVIGMDEYERFLVQTFGRGPLRALIQERLLHREAARLGVSVPPEEVAALAEGYWAEFRDRRHGGDEEAALAELKQEGFDKESFLANQRRQEEQRLLTDAIVRATRAPSEEDVRRRFEHEYGVGGERVTVRHVFFSRGRLLNDLRRANAPAERMTADALDAELVAQAKAVLAELRAGGDFATIARERSHDLSAKLTGGEIPNYNYEQYGERFAEAVRGTAVGVPSGPIRSASGIHVYEVTSRVHTDLEDVRDAVLALIASDPATGQERSELEERLFAEASIATY